MGADTHPNNPDTGVFCANIASLAGVQSGLKALVGNVDPTDESTIANTQPSAGEMQTFIEATNGTLVLGDESVPPIVAQSWATATAGLRALIRTFQLVGYNLSALPPSAVEQIVLGANGVKLPGVPVDTDVVGATEALTAFYTSVCAPTTPPPANNGGGTTTTTARPRSRLRLTSPADPRAKCTAKGPRSGGGPFACTRSQRPTRAVPTSVA